MKNVSCDFCGCSQAKELYRLPDYLLDRFERETTLVQCNQCGLVYQNPRLSEEELAPSYPDDYEPFKKVRQNSSKLSRWIRGYGIQKRIQVILQLVKQGRLLDVGCAGGTFLSAMLEHPNWELHGVEPNKAAAEAASKHERLYVANGTLEQIHYPNDFFDVVTLWDVLEHVSDPAASLLEIQRILKPEGVVAIRLPNLDSWEAKFFGKYWVGLDAPRHLFIFGKKNIREMLIQRGFNSITIKTGIGSYPGFVLSIRFWLSSQRVNKGLRKLILAGMSFFIFRLLTAPIFFIIEKLGYGSSMIITAHKEFNPY